ncbi:MAG TPA: bile acid:sodium symporter family protein [Verrucomicrobiae bacterium]|nr:bile acid:sodium symporter family protein [Verrucomicrobiae bacterium]
MQPGFLISVGLPIAIGIIMCGIGLHLTAADFRRVTEFPRSVLVGVAGHYLLLPALGFVTAWLFRLPPELAVGLVLVAACPSGNIANTMTFLARGNVALAVCLSVISALVTFISIPLFVGLASEAFMGEERAVRVPVLETVKHLAGILLLPIVAGMLVRDRLPRVAAAVQPWVSRFAVLMLVVLILGIVFTQGDALGAAALQAGPAALALCCAAIGGGWVLGRLARLPPRDVITVSLEVGVQNAALAILIALSVLDAAQMAIPGALYGGLMYLPAVVVVAIGRRRARAAAAAAT